MNIHSVPPTALAKPDAILASALELFAERSYGMAPVPLVAERAGVAAGTIYRYFPGKEGLVNALYRQWKQRLATTVFDGVDLDAAPRLTFEQIWSRLCAFAVEHPQAFAFLETHHHEPYLDAESRALTHAVDARVAAEIARWQAAGAVRAGEPLLLLAQVFGGLVGVVRAQRAAGAPLTTELFTHTFDAAWRSIAAERNPS
jgi:TetR/AcrR family transcriptional regulator, repressor of fatR-cypB operon